MKKIKEEKPKQTNKKIKSYLECGICKKTFPANQEKSPEEIIPAWIKVEVGNEEHRIPICADCLRHILYE
jgi:ribosomal protein L28